MHSIFMAMHDPSQAHEFIANGLWRNLLLYSAPSQDAVSHPEYLAAGGNPKGFHTDEIIRRRLTDLVKDGHLIPNAVRGIAKREAMSA